jgi:hypothetical protein
MKKNDRVVLVVGIVILILAGTGIYYWDYTEENKDDAIANDFVKITGKMVNMPDGITVSNSDPFYAVIATPLAINYCEKNEQSVIPLIVKDLENPSDSVIKFFGEQVNILPDLEIDNSKSAEDLSIELAETYWKSSDAALIIENNFEGYKLGVALAPVASYLRIPILVGNNTNTKYTEVLDKLGVEYTLICGNIDGFGSYKLFKNIDEIMNFSIDIINNKFNKDVDYITLTNPIDAFPPKVLDSEEFYFGPKTIPSGASTLGFFRTSGTPKTKIGEFKIPEGYKYALVKFEGENIDYEGVDEFGDNAGFTVGIVDETEHPDRQLKELFSVNTRAGGWADRDSNGNVIKDYVYTENVLYDRGGATYKINSKGTWLTKTNGRVQAKVTIEKLDHPVYPMMHDLSSVSPYLTAYRQGIIFARPEFAFTADDDVITNRGRPSPGPYMALRNIALIEPSNNHMIEEINIPLNNLLADLAGIEIKDDRDIKRLRNHYVDNPVYITLVGGATMLPQYYYDNFNQPIDVEKGNYGYGSGTPSDVLYGNIDPIPTDWSNEALDIYSTYPFQENIVGRITGYDAQDASTLIGRTIFYDEILENMEGDWKNNFGLIMGGGTDFRKPAIRYTLFGDILGMVHAGEPLKLWTGFSQISGERTKALVAKPLEFNVLEAWEEHGQNVGFTDEALDEIQDNTLVNKLLFRKHLVRNLVGVNVVKGGDIMQNSNFLWVNGHGSVSTFGMAATKLVASGMGSIFIRKFLLEPILPIIGAGFVGPGSNLADLGDYGTRSCAAMDMGPSFYWLESCICGKIDGVYAKNSVGQAILHSGVNSLIAASTTSNIAGGYLEPKTKVKDFGLETGLSYIKAVRDMNRGKYPEPHFGSRLYDALCEDLRENDCSIGIALRNSKNVYIQNDADWLVWWSPPLVKTGDVEEDYAYYKEMVQNYEETARSGPSPMMKNKFTSNQEYILFGDPAFNPYEKVKKS